MIMYYKASFYTSEGFHLLEIKNIVNHIRDYPTVKNPMLAVPSLEKDILEKYPTATNITIEHEFSES